MNKGIFALSTGTFAQGITEFVIMGLLVTLADDMGISVARAGDFISAYASGVCVGAVLMLLFRRMPLKRMVMMLAAVITIGNAATACAPEYWTMIAARFVAGLPHGAFFGVGAIVARRLASPGHEVRAVSYMIAGMTVATLAGVPVGTFITNALSWRAAFAIVALAGATTYILARMWLPHMPALPDHGFRNQFHFLRTLPPWLIVGGVIFAQTGLYCWYSYIDPQLTTIARFSTADLSWLMVVAGAGMFIGNLASGRLCDRFKPSAVAAGVMVGGVVVLLLIFFFFDIKWLAVALLLCGTGAGRGKGI